MNPTQHCYSGGSPDARIPYSGLVRGNGFAQANCAPDPRTRRRRVHQVIGPGVGIPAAAGHASMQWGTTRPHPALRRGGSCRPGGLLQRTRPRWPARPCALRVDGARDRVRDRRPAEPLRRKQHARLRRHRPVPLRRAHHPGRGQGGDWFEVGANLAPRHPGAHAAAGSHDAPEARVVLRGNTPASPLDWPTEDRASLGEQA